MRFLSISHRLFLLFRSLSYDILVWAELRQVFLLSLYVQHSTPYPVWADEALECMDRNSSAPLLFEDLTTWLRYAWLVDALSTVELWTVCQSFNSLEMRALTARFISLSRNPLYSAPYPAPLIVCPALTDIRMVSTSSPAYLAINKYIVS